MGNKHDDIYNYSIDINILELKNTIFNTINLIKSIINW